LHGATMDMRKKAPRDYGLDRGASIGALWAGRIKRAITVWWERWRSAATLGNYSRDGAAEKGPARVGLERGKSALGLGGKN
jgi:hypothetical protein